MPDFHYLEVYDADGVGVVALNRPEVLNAIFPGMCAELHEVLDRWATADHIRTVILRGNGRAFCSGGDVNIDVGTLSGLGHDGALELSRIAQLSAHDIFEFPKPVIAQVHGAAVGGGMDLALACDMIIAAEKTKFGQYWTRRGLIPDMGGGWFLPRLIGLHRAKDLVLTGRTILAEEAYAWGLCNQVVPENTLATTVAQTAAQLASMPTQALMQSKRLMNITASESLRTYFEMANASIPFLAGTDDHEEGIRAYTERREPRYTGQ